MKSGYKSDFPIFDRPIIYFDNAATTQKPAPVIAAIADFYKHSNANVHRGIHILSEEATQQYERARKKVAKFINAKSEKEIIFVRNTTEAINLLAYTLNPKEVTTTIMEHHSNYLPWQRVAKLDVVDINKDFELCSMKHGARGLFAVTQASNVLGTINDISKIHASNPMLQMVVDGAQAVPHFKVDVQKLGCDFYAFSGHKMFGPMGIGVLWGKQELLETMNPFMVGGGMISNEIPEKFEAGTPNVADAIGLEKAIEYLENLGFKEIEKLEKQLSDKLLSGIGQIAGLKLIGPQKNRVPAFSFVIDGIHPHDAAQFLSDRYQIAVRAGQHCAGPLHKRLGLGATLRVSLAFYNTEEEIDIFFKAMKDLIKTLR